MKLKCKGCAATAVAKGATGSIGHIADKTGFAWVPSAGSDSIWVCRSCAKKLLKLAQGIVELVGEIYSYPPTLLKQLQRFVAKGAKR